MLWCWGPYGAGGRVGLRAVCWRPVAGTDPLPQSCFTGTALDSDPVTATVSVTGGNSYRLLYVNFKNGDNGAFRSGVEAYTGTAFPTLTFEDRGAVRPFPNTQRDFSFALPRGTTGIRLSFLVQVKPQGVFGYNCSQNFVF